jgi:hypothetical protein
MVTVTVSVAVSAFIAGVAVGAVLGAALLRGVRRRVDVLARAAASEGYGYCESVEVPRVFSWQVEVGPGRDAVSGGEAKVVRPPELWASAPLRRQDERPDSGDEGVVANRDAEQE